MVYGFIFLGLLLSCIGLGIANIILKKVKNKRAEQESKKKGEQ